jgi:hypothetical protein
VGVIGGHKGPIVQWQPRDHLEKERERNKRRKEGKKEKKIKNNKRFVE